MCRWAAPTPVADGQHLQRGGPLQELAGELLVEVPEDAAEPGLLTTEMIPDLRSAIIGDRFVMMDIGIITSGCASAKNYMVETRS